MKSRRYANIITVKIYVFFFKLSEVHDAGIVRQPKWGHLKDVHKAIKLCEEALIATDPTITTPGPNIEVISGQDLWIIFWNLKCFIFSNFNLKYPLKSVKIHGSLSFCHRFL